jgi:hypothetical protein
MTLQKLGTKDSPGWRLGALAARPLALMYRETITIAAILIYL